MNTFQLQLSDLTLDRDDIYLNLGYKGATPDECINEMLEEVISKAYEICKPRALFCICKGTQISTDILEVQGIHIKIGRVIARYFHPSTHYAAFVVSAGKEYNDYLHELNNSGDVVTGFLADAVGSEIAEATVRYVTERVAEEAQRMDCRITNAYSPGYCSWHVREQKALFSLFPEKPCGVILNESCLMLPEKSVSGMIGLGKEITDTPNACEICGLVTCYKRKTALAV